MTTFRCTTPHWQGNDFIAAGTILPAGDAQIIPQFFEPIEDDAPPAKTAAKKTTRKSSS